MMNIFFPIIASAIISYTSNTNPCERKIKQPWKHEVYKVYYFEGLGYVVGTYQQQAVPEKDGYINANNPTYKQVFVRLVFNPEIRKYYPWPDNQYGPHYEIWAKDSCSAKEYWFRYEAQWKK